LNWPQPVIVNGLRSPSGKETTFLVAWRSCASPVLSKGIAKCLMVTARGPRQYAVALAARRGSNNPGVSPPAWNPLTPRETTCSCGVFLRPLPEHFTRAIAGCEFAPKMSFFTLRMS
jgi:hypothetical protein